MNHAFIESRKAVEKAREALRQGDRTGALKWGQEAARLAPQSEDPWLILAAVASPQASVDYIRKALDANPESARARKGMIWAMERLQKSQQETPAPAPLPQEPAPAPAQSGRPRKLIFPALLLVLGCLVVMFAAWSAVKNPALAAIRSLTAPHVAVPTARPLQWAQAELPKPTYAPTLTALPVTHTESPTSLPTQTLEPPASSTPEPLPSIEPSATTGPGISAQIVTIPGQEDTTGPTLEVPVATPVELTPGLLQAAIVEDTPTSEYAPPALPAPVQPPDVAAAANGEHWIDVDLSRQMVYAYAGDTLMNSFLVSTGTWQTPTVTGTYHIWIKLRSTTMTGPGYYLPNVPYTMYFYKGYGLHGTYWHNNFGTPMSHGCVNLSIPDSEWLYNFSSVGTTVNVHY
jgi:lipoprotein-anchoring transpeptidase ErfK/SrfK